MRQGKCLEIQLVTAPVGPQHSAPVSFYGDGQSMRLAPRAARRSRATHEVYVRAPLAIAFCARLSESRKRMASCCCSGSELAPGIERESVRDVREPALRSVACESCGA